MRWVCADDRLVELLVEVVEVVVEVLVVVVVVVLRGADDGGEVVEETWLLKVAVLVTFLEKAEDCCDHILCWK